MGEWGTVEHLLAMIAEHTQWTNESIKGAHYVSAAGSKQPYQPDYLRLPRLGQETEMVGEAQTAKPRRMSTPGEIRRFFGGAIRYQGEEVNSN